MEAGHPGHLTGILAKPARRDGRDPAGATRDGRPATVSGGMEDTFDLSTVGDEAALVFQHMEADAHFGASVFWTRRAGALGDERAMIEYWQIRRDGGRRGIVEIMPEES
jgi:hypothetical protein